MAIFLNLYFFIFNGLINFMDQLVSGLFIKLHFYEILRKIFLNILIVVLVIFGII